MTSTQHALLIGAMLGISALACGGEAEDTKKCERTDARACDAKDPKKVYYVDSCGQREEIATSCLGEFTCVASSATEAACANASQQCEPTAARACDPAQPRRVYEVDSCGALTNRWETCLGDAVCEATSATEASCALQGQCTPTATRVCEASDPLHVYSVDSCGNKKVSSTCTGENVQCAARSATEASCECDLLDPPVLGCAAEGAQKIDNPTELGPLNACNQIVEITKTCMLGERCWWDFNEQGMAVSEPFCATSINPRHRAEPTYVMGCDSEIYMAAQTDLKIDCRCNRSNPALQECRPGADAWTAGLRRGAGPHTRGINLQEWGGGFISKDRKELFTVVQYTGGQVNLKPGAIYAFNYETGDRRVVSGTYYDDAGRHDVGSGYAVDGEALPFAVDAKLGADGNIYVAGSDTLNNVEITRVNPATGARELVWRRQTDANGMDPNYPFGQCWSGIVSPNYLSGFLPVQSARRAFALAPDGGFYMGWNNDGVGVMHISADGRTCRHVSRWASNNNTAPLPDIGGGVTPQYSTISGLLYHGGKIYAHTRGLLLAIDPTSGDRATFANVGGIGGVGETNFFVDEARQLFFACGTDASRKCSVHNLADGNDAQGLFQIGQAYTLLPGKYPQTQGAKGALDNNNYNGFGAVALDPDDSNVLYFIINFGMVKYEIDTGNSYIMSM